MSWCLEEYKVGLERLERLLAHMQSGVLSVEHFDMRTFRGDRAGCGSFGCMLGECVGLWPEEWVWRPELTLIPGLHDGSTGFMAAMHFFNLSLAEAFHLFDSQGILRRTGLLRGDCSRAEAAEHLEKFVVKRREFVAALEQARLDREMGLSPLREGTL
jgi:hypothetical protein